VPKLVYYTTEYLPCHGSQTLVSVICRSHSGEQRFLKLIVQKMPRVKPITPRSIYSSLSSLDGRYASDVARNFFSVHLSDLHFVSPPSCMFTTPAACSRRLVNRYDEYDNEVAGILSVAPSLFEGVGLRPPPLPPIDDPDVVDLGS